MRAALTVMAIWAAGLGAAAQFGKISVLYDVLGATYPGHDGVGIALMVSVVGMVGLIFGTTAGILVTRIGPRRAMLAALGKPGRGLHESPPNPQRDDRRCFPSARQFTLRVWSACLPKAASMAPSTHFDQ